MLNHAKPKTNRHYNLSDAFNALGDRLYGPEWTGYEIWGRRVENPEPILEARAPLEQRLEEVFSEKNAKEKELREPLSREEMQRVNNDLVNIREEQHKIYARLSEIGNPSQSQIEDHGRWERFDRAEQLLLRAFRVGDLTVQCFLGLTVKSELWSEIPEGFGFDWELSIIFLPERESSKRVNSGRLDREEFESWLYKLTPENSYEGAELSDEHKAQLWLREEAKSWDGWTKRDQFKDQAMVLFPDLSGRGFTRIWNAEASAEMIKTGPKTGK